MTSQVRALYTCVRRHYNEKPIDLCFTIYVLGVLSSAVVTQRVNNTLDKSHTTNYNFQTEM